MSYQRRPTWLGTNALLLRGSPCLCLSGHSAHLTWNLHLRGGCLSDRNAGVRHSCIVAVLWFFLFLRRLSLALLLYLRTVLRNALHLNTASFLRAVHGSLTPFPLAFYGRPFLTRIYFNAVSSLLSHRPSLPLYPPQFLCYEHRLVRTLLSHLFKTTTSHVSSLTWIYSIIPCHLDLSKSSHYFWVCAPWINPWTPLEQPTLLWDAVEAPSIYDTWRRPSSPWEPSTFLEFALVSTWAKRNRQWVWIWHCEPPGPR